MHSMSLESRSTNTNHFLLTYLLIVCEKCFMIMFKLKPIIFSSNQNSQNFCWMHKDMWGKTSEISQVILPSDIIIVPEIRYQKYPQK